MRKILFVEDNNTWRNLWKAIIAEERCLSAETIDEAVCLVEKHHEDIVMAVFDFRVPDEEHTSLPVIRRLRELRGEKVYIVGTSAHDEHLRELWDSHLCDTVVSKLKAEWLVGTMDELMFGV
jgi:CheY-like chemotaxis protein